MKLHDHTTLKMHLQFWHNERGAITIAESLIAIGIGIAILMITAQTKKNDFEYDRAARAGQLVAAYASAAAAWIANEPPAVSGTYSADDLQDCADPDGARYLSCTFSKQTAIPYAFDPSNNPINFGALEIVVNVGASGAVGTIDFGTFRAGGEAAGTVPLARSDLAAVVYKTAAQQTHAGAFEYFNLAFAKEDLTGLITNPSDPSYDQSAIDDLARILAQVGSIDSNTPFLRLDGSNQMTGALTFNNGMQIGIDGNGLTFGGEGDIEIQTLSGGLLVSGNIGAAMLTADSVEVDALKVAPANGVSGAGFDRLDQSSDIVRIDGDITSLKSNVQANATAHRDNQAKIATNASQISLLGGKVNVNTAAIGQLQTDLNQTNQDLDSLESNIASISSSLPKDTLCSPSKSELIASKAASGYQIHFDLSTGVGTSSCHSGYCTAVDRCGDTISLSKRRPLHPWKGNPGFYKVQSAGGTSCVSYRVNFYRSCPCVAPDPGSCK